MIFFCCVTMGRLYDGKEGKEKGFKFFFWHDQEQERQDTDLCGFSTRTLLEDIVLDHPRLFSCQRQKLLRKDICILSGYGLSYQTFRGYIGSVSQHFLSAAHKQEGEILLRLFYYTHVIPPLLLHHISLLRPPKSLWRIWKPLCPRRVRCDTQQTRG